MSHICSGHALQGGRPGAEPRHAGEITCLGWVWKAPVYPGRGGGGGWETEVGSFPLKLLHDSVPDNWQKMDGQSCKMRISLTSGQN